MTTTEEELARRAAAEAAKKQMKLSPSTAVANKPLPGMPDASHIETAPGTPTADWHTDVASGKTVLTGQANDARAMAEAIRTPEQWAKIEGARFAKYGDQYQRPTNEELNPPPPAPVKPTGALPLDRQGEYQAAVAMGQGDDYLKAFKQTQLDKRSVVSKPVNKPTSPTKAAIVADEPTPAALPLSETPESGFQFTGGNNAPLSIGGSYKDWIASALREGEPANRRTVDDIIGPKISALRYGTDMIKGMDNIALGRPSPTTAPPPEMGILPGTEKKVEVARPPMTTKEMWDQVRTLGIEGEDKWAAMDAMQNGWDPRQYGAELTPSQRSAMMYDMRQADPNRMQRAREEWESSASEKQRRLDAIRESNRWIPGRNYRSPWHQAGMDENEYNKARDARWNAEQDRQQMALIEQGRQAGRLSDRQAEMLMAKYKGDVDMRGQDMTRDAERERNLTLLGLKGMDVSNEQLMQLRGFQAAADAAKAAGDREDYNLMMGRINRLTQTILENNGRRREAEIAASAQTTSATTAAGVQSEETKAKYGDVLQRAQASYDDMMAKTLGGYQKTRAEHIKDYIDAEKAMNASSPSALPPGYTRGNDNKVYKWDNDRKGWAPTTDYK